MKPVDWDLIAQQITAHSGQPFRIQSTTAIGGGCINQAFKVSDENHSWFIKLNSVSRLAMLAAEKTSLLAIAETGAIRVPQPLCIGTTRLHSYLVLEYIDFNAHQSAGDEAFGIKLANMHGHKGHCYGWSEDNTIGSTPQINTEMHDWCDFWREHRLGFQLRLAAVNGYQGRLQQRGEKLLACLNEIFADYRPEPSLLHGDLWSGNYACSAAGDVVIFDPASYFGDREADLAMTELFGGFSSRFYQAYQATWPLTEGYPVRKQLYNLYHILNHLNLFGEGYLGQAEAMTDRLLAELT